MRPHPFAERVYLFEDFVPLLTSSKDFHHRSFDFEGSIGTVGETAITDDNFKSLLEKAEPSQVGVNTDTVFNESLRSSQEIPANQINFSSDFLSYVNQQVESMAVSLHHPIKVTAKPHKLILYQEGDFFEEHIDSCHHPGMVMTLLIDLTKQTYQGGDLLMHSEIPVPPRSMILFYHDTAHSVAKLREGFKISLTFDVVETDQLIPEIIDPWRSQLSSGLDKLRQRQVHRVGFLCSHLYVDEINLKGADRIIWEFLKAEGLEPRTQELCHNDSGKWFCRELLDVFSLNEAFNELYCEYEDGALDELSLSEMKIDDYSEIRLNLSGGSSCLKKRYLLGDVVLIGIESPNYVKYESTSEVYLGNEGFDDKIYENLAILVDI